MKIRVLNILILLLFFNIAAFAEIYTTPDGYSVEINLIPDKSEILINEPVYFSFEIKNLSKDELGFVQGGDYRNEFGRPESFKVEAVQDNGNLAEAVESRANFGGMIVFSKIPVGETLMVRLLSSHWFKFENAGNYVVRCSRQMIVAKYDSPDVSDKFRLPGFPVEVKTAIVVKPENYKKLGNIIDKIGNQIFDGNYEKSLEAVKSLSFINDNRVIKYFDRLIEKTLSNDEKSYNELKFYAFRPLAKFVEQSALTAIVKGINSKNDDTRRNVSIALSLSLNPKAEKYLLLMRNDKFDAIRLDVAHYLGTKRTPASTEILKTMLNDESEIVRNQAETYLKERNAKID